MIAENLTIVAPMLESKSLYSNFWCGLTLQVKLVFFLETCAKYLLKLQESDRSGSFNAHIGLLQTNPRVYSHPQMEATGLLCSPHGALHLPAGPEAQRQPSVGLPPSSPPLSPPCRWHHGRRFLCTASRSDLWKIVLVVTSSAFVTVLAFSLADINIEQEI